MPTLLQINITANWGSTGKIAESIGLTAMKHGWESYIAFGRWSNLSKSQLIKIGGRLDKYFHFAEQRIFDNEGLCSRSATKKLIRQIKEIKPDVIQLHNIHDHYLNYQILFNYLNQTDIKVVWTFHDCWAFTGHCVHFVTANCMRWQTGCYECPMKGYYPKSFVDKSSRNYELKKNLFTANKNMHIVTVSEWLQSLVKQSFFKEKEICVINNGVDVELFHPIPLSDNNYSEIRVIRDRGYKFVTIGLATLWNEEKGLSDYLKLSQMLADDEALVLVGVSEKVKKTLPERIICVPRTSSITELAMWYAVADVVLSLSKAETFGMTIAEGMACGTPGIVHDNTAHRELIAEGTGFVVDDGNVESVYSRIKEVKTQGKDAFSEACRKRAEEFFDKNKCFEKYVRLYEELIAY
jgi:glycosyltransferase involved in cell wall biosynthesis